MLKNAVKYNSMTPSEIYYIRTTSEQWTKVPLPMCPLVGDSAGLQSIHNYTIHRHLLFIYFAVDGSKTCIIMQYYIRAYMNYIASSIYNNSITL